MKNHTKQISVMNKSGTLFLAAMLLAGSSMTSAQNKSYINNRIPLASTPFVSLPLGSIEPQGWLATQLHLQKEGLTGYAEQIYNELNSNSGWLGGNGADSDWERPTYYVKGLVGLAYSLNDQALKTKAQKWINWTLNSQLSNGSFGPASSNDWWARMPMLTALMDYCDATGDARVAPFLTKYFRYQFDNIQSRPFNSWAKARAADNVDVIVWVYNRTGDAFLLDLIDRIRTQSYDYTSIFTDNTFLTDFNNDEYPMHGVNVAQAYKYAPVFYQRSKTNKDKDAYMTGIQNLTPYHTQITGMNSGTERLSGNSSIQGVELCSTVERMFCDELASRILGDARIGDGLEKIAFNQLPGTLSEDFHQHQYYSIPNQVLSKKGSHGFAQDYDNAAVPGPYSGYPCCRFNLHMGWPKYSQFCWMATSDNGLAATAYAPSRVKAKVSDGDSVTILEDTHYPFEEQIRFTIQTAKIIRFPVKLRIPEWCSAPVVKVNGEIQNNVVPGQYYTINRNWSNGDAVILDLPMSIKATTWLNQSVGIERGPLVYSLQMSEDWRLKTQHNFAGKDFSEYEVYPQNAWNYGLVIDRENPSSSIRVEKTSMTGNPFASNTTPVKLKIKARKIPGWGLVTNGMHPYEPPFSPVLSTEPEEEITLIPFGAERIRLTYFPVIGTPIAPETTFKDSFPTNGPNKWVNFGGGWQQKSGKYYAQSFGVGGMKSVAINSSFGDFTYDATISILDNNAQGGVIFRVSKPADGTNAFIGYYAGLNTSGQIVLGKSNNSWSEIKSVSAIINKSTAYHLRVVTKGSSIKIFVDDMSTPKISVTDNSYKTGAIGLRAYGGQTVIYENVSVTPTENTAIHSVKSENLKCSPNPVKDFLTMDNIQKDALVQIYDTNSKLLISEKTINNQLFVGHLAEGLYLVKTDQNTEATKFIKK